MSLRRFVSLLLFLLLFHVSSLLAALPGDVNLNGSLDPDDQTVLTDHILGRSLLTGEALANADVNGDGKIDIADVVALSITVFGPPQLVESSPQAGESGVAVTRETILTFDKPLDPASLTEAALFARFGEQILPAMLHLSPDAKRVTMFYQDPLPPSARVRVTINGAVLKSALGTFADGDLDGHAGGSGFIDFDTLSLTSVPNTSLVGRIFASELGMMAGTPVDVPLQGVTISIDGTGPWTGVVTDANGNYRLDNIPAGSFFVHIDGRTVTQAMIGGVPTATHFPDGPYYPYVGKPFMSSPGRETQMMDLYLPLVPAGTLVPVSNTQDTMVGFPQSVLNEHPEYAGVHLMVPAGSLYSDSGTHGGMVGIAPVSPDRLPGALPEDLKFALVISVQTDGATNFDVPVPVCFPNLPDPVTQQTLPPGAKSALWSFNHDTGQFEIAGPMTVSQDGTLVCSDPGFGIKAPGWHATQPGCSGDGGDADEMCEGGTGSGLARSVAGGTQPPMFGPIDVSPVTSPGTFIFRVRAPEAGTVTWFLPGAGQPDPPPRQLQAGEGVLEQASYCAAGTFSVQATFFPACGGTTLAAFASVTVREEDLDHDMPNITITSSTSQLLTQHRIDFDSGTPNTHGRLSWDIPGDATTVQSIDGKQAQADWCTPGTYHIVLTLERECGEVVHATKDVTIGDVSGVCFSLGIHYDLVEPIGSRAAQVPLHFHDTFGFNRVGLDSVTFRTSRGSRTLVTPVDQIGLTFGDFTETYPDTGHQTVMFEYTTYCEGSGQPITCTQRLDFDVEIALVPLTPPGVEPKSASTSPVVVEGQPRGAGAVARRKTSTPQLQAISPRSRDLATTLRSRNVTLDPGRKVARGLTYFAIQNLTNDFVTRGVGGSEGVVHTKAVRLAPLTPYRELILNAETMEIASADYTTPASGLTFEIPAFHLSPDLSPDSDGDGLPDQSEFILGTDPANADSDGDGVKDGAEVHMGLNPSDGLAVPTGIFASANTPGPALDIFTANNLAVVAEGEAGVTVFNIFNGLTPIRIAQVDTPGFAQAVALVGTRVAVADGAEGLVVIDIADPPSAFISREIKFEADATSVAAAAGLAYVGLKNGAIVEVQMETGLEVARLMLSSPADDIVLGGDFLYTHEPDFSARVSAIPLNGPFAVVGSAFPSFGSAPNLDTRQRIFAADGIVYSVRSAGYGTFDFTNPALPLRLGGETTSQLDWKQIVLNGTGLGVAAVGSTASPGSSFDNIQIYDTSDPLQTNRFLTQIDTPGIANAVSIFNGIAYVADGPAGMQEVNYLAYDIGNVPPIIQLKTNFAAGLAGEGQLVTVTAVVSDDVQVRNVEFFVDGKSQAVDGSFPFEFRFIAPLRSQQATVSIQARATDTGGNSTLTSPQVLTLTDDATPPAVLAAIPTNGSHNGRGILSLISALFSEPMAPSSVNSATFQIVRADSNGSFDSPDAIVLGPAITYNAASRMAEASFVEPLHSGLYRARITTGATDLKGNSLASDFDWTFEVDPPRVVSLTPPDGSTVRAGSIGNVIALFDTDMNGSSITPSTFRVFAAGGDGMLGTFDDVLVSGGVLSYRATSRSAELTFDPPLHAGLYRATIAPTVRDFAGNPLASDVTWSFTLEGPRVISVTPPNGSLRGENRISQLQAAFSTDMDPATINPSSFELFDAGPDGDINTLDDRAFTSSAVFYIPEQRRAFYDLPGTLPLGDYRAVVHASATSTFGEPLSADFGWNFSIVQAPFEKRLFSRPALLGGNNTSGVVIADFNDDGINDIAMGAAGDCSVTIYLGDRDGMFFPSISYPIGVAVYALVGADLNNDGSIDLIAAKSPFNFGGCSGDDRIGIILNQGDGTFAAPLTLQTGPEPFGVAVGDLNGDGSPDIAVTVQGPSQDGPSSLVIFLNRGDATFAPAPPIALGMLPTGIAMGDFDRDGNLDMAAINSGDGMTPGTLVVFRNAGDATFSGPDSYPLGVFPMGLTAGDLNGDGKLDLVAANSKPDPSQGGSGSSYSVLLGRGDGTFDPPVTVPSGAVPEAVALGDLNGDGVLDIAGAARGGASSPTDMVSVLFGAGNGTFNPESLTPAGATPTSVAIGDLDQTGGRDIAISGFSQWATDLIFGKGDGTFEPFPASFPAGEQPGDIIVGNFNADTHLDVAVRTRGATQSVNHAFTILLGRGDGNFDPPVQYDLSTDSQLPNTMAAADVDGDNKTDFVLTNAIFQGVFQPSLSVFTNNGDGTYTNIQDTLIAPQVSGNTNITTAILTKLDTNSATDLILGLSGSGSDPFNIQVWHNDGHGIFSAGQKTNFSAPIRTIGAEDFTGDGKVDLVVVTGSGAEDQVRILPGNGDGTFQAAVTTLNVPETAFAAIAIADFTGDGSPDILLLSQNDPPVAMLLRGLGGGAFEIARSLPVGKGAASIAVGDVDGDGRPDAIIPCRTAGGVSVLLGRGDLDGLNTGQFARQPLFITNGSQPAFAAVGDFDEDGDDDLAVTVSDPTSSNASVDLLQNRRIP